nr:MAG TPA: hypothetical protein [Bacteriophage sp.]
MEEGIYYKRGSKSDFASVDMLPGGQDIPRIIIERIFFHEKLVINGRKETEQWTAKFAPNPWCNKEMVLNSTNRTRIAKQHWEDIVEDGTACEGRINLLKNIPVRLTREQTRDVQNGGTTYGLRISRYAPMTEEEMNTWMVEHGFASANTSASRKIITKDKIDVIVGWAKKNGLNLSQIKELYDFEDQTVESAVLNGITVTSEESDGDLPE